VVNGGVTPTNVAWYLAALRRMPRRRVLETGVNALRGRISSGELRQAQVFLGELQALGMNVVALDDRDYPQALSAIPDPPALLFVKGDRSVLHGRCVAIVGSRRASVYGLTVARDFAKALACRGVTIVSGLATGIDTAAHEGALEGGGRTAAVFGCGLLHCYPAGNRPLVERMLAASGAIVSEYEPDVMPRKHHFPERNRVISGLCEATIVVEATTRSGSLITARMALEQGRDVLAVPGLIHAEGSRGCHRLIREGAGLADSIDTLLDELGLAAQDTAPVPQDGARARILECLGENLGATPGEPVPADVLASRLGLPMAEAVLLLVELELAGFVEAVDGGYIPRLSSA
jgi:DNA processing protein